MCYKEPVYNNNTFQEHLQNHAYQSIYVCSLYKITAEGLVLG